MIFKKWSKINCYLSRGFEINFLPFWLGVKIFILAPRHLIKSSNQKVIKIKVLHIDETYLECGLTIKIRPLTCGLYGPKTDFPPFSLFWGSVNIMPNEQGDCRLACRPGLIFGLEYHSYIYHVPTKILKNRINHLFGPLYLIYNSAGTMCPPPALHTESVCRLQ